MLHLGDPFRCRLLAVLAIAWMATCAQGAVQHPAEAWIGRSIAAMRVDPDLSKHAAEEALKILQRKSDPDLEIRARLLLCDYYSERDNAEAEAQRAAAAALLPQAQRTALQAGVLNCEGSIKEAAGDNESALMLYRQAVDKATAAHDNELLADSLFARGYLLGLRGEYISGLQDLQQSQKLYEQLNKQQHALTALNSIATLYNRMGDYAQAKHIYLRTLQAQHAAGMRREEAVTQHNLARAYENLGEWSAAAEAFTNTLRISRELNYPRGQAYALRGLAATAIASGNFDAALMLLDDAQKVQKETLDARLNAQIQQARGIALHHLGRLTESATVLEHAKDIFERAGSLNELNPIYTELAAVQAANGNWRKAYEYRSLAQSLTEKLLQMQLDQRFATLKIEFDTAAKEKENALLLRENAANRKALEQQRKAARLQIAVVILAALLLLGLLTAIVVHQRRRTHNMRVLAMTDELTAMPNRRAALARLSLMLRNSDACGVLIVDIDHFKSINDNYGHPVGDETLKLVAAKLREAVYEPAFVGRLGGEEFVMVLPRVSLESACRSAESLRETIGKLDLSNWLAQRHITVSIGVSVSCSEDNVSSLLRRADAALYAAKNGGRNCVRSAPSGGGAENNAAKPRLVVISNS